MAGAETRNTAGFTIIELMIVLVIIGITLTIAAPNFRGFVRENRVKTSARAIAVSLQIARLKAISSNRRCFVDFAPGSFSPADSFYTVWLDMNSNLAYDSGESDSTHLVQSDTKGSFKGYKLSQGVKFGVSGVSTGPESAAIPADGVDFGGSNRVGFNSRGVGTAGGVYLTAENGSKYAITVSGLGAVRTWKWDNSQWK
jgi:prepilin-type N-terminal cleavage/methylation domain-containing protein